MMLALDRAGYIELPAVRYRPPNPFRKRCPPEQIELDGSPLCGELSKLGPLTLRQVRRTPEEQLFERLLETHHYLGYTQPVGELLHWTSLLRKLTYQPTDSRSGEWGRRRLDWGPCSPWQTTRLLREPGYWMAVARSIWRLRASEVLRLTRVKLDGFASAPIEGSVSQVTTVGKATVQDDAASAPQSLGPVVEQVLASLDPELRQAVTEVDRSLVRLSLSMSPRDRLRSASNILRTLTRFRRVPASSSR